MIWLVLLSNHQIVANFLFQICTNTILLNTGKLERPSVRACQRLSLVRMARVNMQMAMEVKLLTVVNLTMAMAVTLAMALTLMAVNLQLSFLHLTHLLPVLRPTPSKKQQN